MWRIDWLFRGPLEFQESDQGVDLVGPEGWFRAALLIGIAAGVVGAIVTLTGDAAGNILNGAFGNDSLTGNGGSDTFRFDSALSASNNVDTVTDFDVPADTIQLDNAVFTALGAPGFMNPSNFTVGSSAADADDFIVYDITNGFLYYDADGNAAGAQVAFAHLSAGLALTSADFFII